MAGNFRGIFRPRLGVIFEYFQRHGTFDMQVTLRKCDFDPIGMKAIPNRLKNRVLDIGNPILGIVYPNPQLKIDRAVTEIPYKAFRFGDL